MSDFVDIREREAVMHSSYGFKGWVMFFWFWFLIGELIFVYNLVSGTLVEYAHLVGAPPGLYIAQSVVSFVLYLPMVIFLPMRDARAITWGIPAMITAFVIAIFTSFIMMSFGMALLAIAISGAFLILIIWYFRSSVRVNVTYLHRVRPEDRQALFPR